MRSSLKSKSLKTFVLFLLLLHVSNLSPCSSSLPFSVWTHLNQSVLTLKLLLQINNGEMYSHVNFELLFWRALFGWNGIKCLLKVDKENYCILWHLHSVRGCVTGEWLGRNSFWLTLNCLSMLGFLLMKIVFLMKLAAAEGNAILLQLLILLPNVGIVSKPGCFNLVWRV